MKVKDLIAQDIDIDVCDDVTAGEELCIACCGPIQLTDEAKTKFAEVLELDVEFLDGSAVIKVDAPEDDDWRRRLELATEFFEAAAGYCDDADYDEWFIGEPRR